MTHLTESRDALAKALWVLQATDESLSSEWADRAWDDMGGSEPSEERVDAELLADALIGSGVVIDAATLANAMEQRLRNVRKFGERGSAYYNGAAHMLRAFAALTERSQS